MSDIPEDEGHERRHKFVQHDFDPNDDDPAFVEDEDAAWAEAMTPTEYVLSSEEAMASALDQARHDL